MSEGTVKWFNPRKGYGFIVTADGRDVFVHYAYIQGEGYKTLVEGETVSFDIVEGEKGLRAENVVQKSPPKDKGKAAPESETGPADKAKPESKKTEKKEKDS